MRNIKRIGMITLVLLAMVICLAGQALAANPFMAPWERIPDGEPRVFTDPETGTQRMYVYGSHDKNASGYCGDDHVVWSAPVDDLTNWRHDGVAFHISQLNGLQITTDAGVTKTVNVGSEVLYAPDVIYHPQLEKYYMFAFLSRSYHIFVAESDSPAGPFTNPRYVGDGFDPAVLVDDVKDANGNQRLYLYWSGEYGRNGLACELEPVSMKKIDGTLHISKGSAGAVNGNDTMPHRNLAPFYFFEGPSIRKVEDTYVLSYAKTDAGSGNGKLAEIGYCISDNPYGDPKLGTEWEFGGVIVDNLGEVIENPYYPGTTTTTYKGGNNHGGMIEVNGQWFQIYHRATGVSITRQAMAEAIDLHFVDGKLVIEQAEITSQGFETDGLNPYEPHYAGSACFGLGSYTFDVNPSRNFDPNAQREDWYPVTNLKNRSWLGYKYFNFGDGVADGMGQTLVLSLKEYAAGTVNVYAAEAKEKYTDPEQPRTLIGSAALAGGNSTEHTVEIPVKELAGAKAIYLEFLSSSGSTICELNKLWFNETEAAYADTICLDGVELPEFDAFKFNYKVTLESLEQLPEVTAQAAGLNVAVTQATTENPVATVTVSSENKTNTYTITFKKLVLPSSWDFTKTDKETLLSEWEILDRDDSGWSIDENGLHMAVLPGDLYQATNNAKNVFTLNSPGNWIMDTKVSFNQVPSKVYHQAVIMAFQDIDNYVKLSYEYGVHTMGDNQQKSYVQFAKEIDAKMTQTFQAPVSALDIYYRLKKQEDVYTAYYSLDGENFIKMGSYEATFEEPKIALAAFNGKDYTDDLVATFEYLKYSELPEEAIPEDLFVSFQECTPIGNAKMADSCIEWITTVGSGFSFTYNNLTGQYLQAEIGATYSTYKGGDTVSILSEEISTFTTANTGGWANYQAFDPTGHVTLKPGLNTIIFRTDTLNGKSYTGYNISEVRLTNFRTLTEAPFDRTALIDVNDFKPFGNTVFEPTTAPYTNVGHMHKDTAGKEAGIDFIYINWSDEPVYATVGAKLTTSYGSHTCTTYAITANGEAPLPGSSYYPPNFGTWDVSKYTVVNEIGTVLLLPGENTIRIAADTVSAYGMNIGEVYLQMDEHTAAEVDDLIEAIGEVTLGSKEAIETARAAYEALTDARKVLVTKLEVLEAAEVAYAAAVKDEEERTVAAAAAVDTLILSIGEVTLDSKSTIEAARTAYEVLTDASKALVTRLADLEAAEAAFADLKAAAAVDALIAAMAVEDEASVKAARKAYDALTDGQKALVTKLAKLEEAELYWNTVNNVVSLVLTGKDAVDAIDGEVVYTLSARGMTNLASVAVSIAIPADYLAEPVAAAAEGWMLVAQTRKDGKLHVVIVNTEGANGDGDILTVTARPMETNGMATLTVTAVEMGAYLGEKETFVQADLTEATVTTEIRNNPCDVNKDGVVDMRDISRAQRYYGGSFADADVNRDGTVDVADLIMILNHYTDLFQ